MIRFFSRGSDVIIFYLDASTFIPILLVMRQVGIICGPFLIFWTRTWDFNLFGTEINSYNSASLLESYTEHVLFTIKTYRYNFIFSYMYSFPDYLLHLNGVV